jgi:hypothetical protein
MAQHCRLSDAQLDKLLGTISKHILVSKNNGGKFNPEEFMKNLYTAIATKSSPSDGIDYVQHVPRLIFSAFSLNQEIADHLTDSDVSFDMLNKLRKQFETVEGVALYVGAAETNVKDEVKNFIERQNPTGDVLSSDEYDSVKKADKEQREKARVAYKALPDSGLAVFNQEAQEYDGKKKEDNVLDPDPLKQTYYKVVRRLNGMIGMNFNADNLTMDGVTGIYYKLVKASAIPVEDLYVDEQTYLTTNDDPSAPFPFNKSSETKLKEREDGAVYLVFADKDGNVLHFDQDGKITTPEAGGKMVYTKMRNPFTPNKDNAEKGYVGGVRTLANVLSINDIARKIDAMDLTPEQKADKLAMAKAARESEIAILDASRKYINENPNGTLLYSIRPGNDGYVEESFSNPVKISDLNLEGGFTPTYSTDNVGMRRKGGVYFTVSDYPFPILVITPKFSEIQNFTTNLADAIFGDQLTNLEKTNLLKQFVWSENTNIFENPEGKLVIKQKGTTFEVTADNKEMFINGLNTQVLSINRSLLNGTFQNVVSEDGKIKVVTQNYNKFIADNCSTYLQPNAEGKILRLNAYNKIDPTTASYDKLFPVVAKPKEEQVTKASSIEQSTPTDQTMDDFEKAVSKLDFGLKKAKGMDSRATAKQIAEAREWYTKSPLSKVVPFEILFHITNSNAVAKFNYSAVLLFKGSNFTDLYHEGWHVFSQLFLTKEDKQKLYGEARNLIGTFKTPSGKKVTFREATDFELEEFIAEDFRKYSISNGKLIINGRSARNGIFQKILRFLKALFTGRSFKDMALDQEATGVLKEMYDKLRVGEINDYTPSLNNVQFSTLHKGVEPIATKDEQIEGLTYQDSANLVETIDSLIATKLTKAKLSLASIFVKPELMNLLYQQIKKDIQNIRNRIANNAVKVKEKNTNINPEEFTNNSGGAKGGDMTWDAEGKNVGVTNHKHYTTEYYDKLNDDQKAKIEQRYLAAAGFLGRGVLSATSYGGKLVRRDMIQAQNGEAIYGVTELVKPGTKGRKGYNNKMSYSIPEGGTGYAVASGILLNKPVYVFNQSAAYGNEIGWYKWDSSVNDFVKSETPKLVKNFTGIGTTEINEIGKQAIKEVYENTFKLETTTEQLSVTDQNSLRVLDFALENWGSYNDVVGGQTSGVVAYHKKKSSYINFEDRYSDLSLEEQEEFADANTDQKVDGEDLKKSDQELQQEFGSNTFERKGNENSVFELASKEVVYLIKSLPDVDSKTGKVILNVFGEPKLVNFNTTWGKIINITQGSINKADMFKKLQAASMYYPELVALVDRLQDPSTKVQRGDWPYVNMWGKFFQDFSVYQIPVKEVRVVNSEETGGFKVEFTEASPKNKQVEKNLSAQFEASKGKYIGKNEFGNFLKLDEIKKDFPTAPKNMNEAYAFLRAIGLNLTDNALMRKVLAQQIGPNKPIGYLYKDVTSATEIGNPFKFKNISGRVRDLLVIEAKYSGKYSNNSIELPTGDSAYDLSLNNSITQLFKGLNEPGKNYADIVNTAYLAHLNYANNPQAKYSIMLNSMFEIPTDDAVASNANLRRKEKATDDAKDVQILLVNLAGIKSVIENKQGQYSQGGVKTNELDINSKFIMDLHTMLNYGVAELPRHASKSSSYGMQVSRLYTPYNQTTDSKGKLLATHLYISTGKFANDSGMLAAVDLMRGKLAGEMERIAMVKKGMIPNIPGFNERGAEFAIFDDILPNDLKQRLIEKADEKDSMAVVNSEEFRQDVANAITTYFNELTAENLAFFEEMPFMSPDLVRNVKELARLDAGKTKMEDKEVKELAIKSFTVNHFIHMTETIAMVYGDLAMYNYIKEDFHKRNAAVGSTGKIFSTDQSDFDFIKNLEDPKDGGVTYAASIGVTPRAMDGELHTAVFKDVVKPSVYYDEYRDALIASGMSEEDATATLEPYTKMTEGDGQGWLTFDAYRRLSILESDWTPKQNDLYVKIVKGEEVSPADIAQFFPPRKFQYAGPLKTDKLHIQAFHKFSLAPLVPTMIKDGNMKTLHDNLVKQQLDYALFESGSKLATITTNGEADSFYENDEDRIIKPWNTGDKEYSKNIIFLQYLKDQVAINSTWKDKSIFSTQLRTLIINNLYEEGKPLNPDFEKLVKEFENLLDRYQDVKKKELLDQMGWKLDKNGKPTGDQKSLVKFVNKELSRQELPDHVVEFVDIDPATGLLKNDLSLSLDAEKIEKLLNAIIIKRLVRQKLNGEPLVQLSGAGFERPWRKATDEEMAKYRGTNDLPTYRPGKGKNGATTAMKIKVAMKGDFYKLLKLKHNDGKEIGTRKRLNEMIRDEKWLNKGDHRKMITMTAVRIPVQGYNSMEFMEVYEFLPEEAGNVLIPPAEIVAKSGADFDIDKLTVFMPNFSSAIDRSKINKEAIKKLSEKYPTLDFSRDNVKIILDAAENGFEDYKLTAEEKSVYKVLQDEFSSPEYQTKGIKGMENKIIESIRKILEHPANFADLIRPNDTNLTKTVADDLGTQNIQGYDPLATKTNPARVVKKKRVTSPTRSLEPRYNLYKHESNNIGKKALGIGAVDNKYSAILKRIGAYLEEKYTKYKIDYETGQFKRDKTGNVVKEVRPVAIRMEHNTMIIDGKERISLSGLDTKTRKKVSDLISQLMNGWVDIERDAWIFNINGNNVAGPILLFLIEAGVDFKTAAHFISQPLIIDYIKERTKADSPFYAAAEGDKGGEFVSKSLRTYNVRKKFFLNMNLGPVKKSKEGKTYLSSEDMFASIMRFNQNKTYTLEGLQKIIKEKDRTSDEAKAGLLHFIELEELSSKMTNVKLTMNPDTKPTKSLLAAQEKIQKVEDLEYNDVMDQSFYKKIKTNSPISSFFIQDFQLAVLKPLMNLRGSEKINDFIIHVFKTFGNNKTFSDKEKFQAAFHNDLPLFILQNYIKGFDLNKATEFNSLPIGTKMDVKGVTLQNGAFVKDGIMYVDKDQIKKDFETKAYAGKGYTDLGLQVLPAATFDMLGDKNIHFQEYSQFVLEREYLRSITPVQEGQSRELYERNITERALRKTFNFYYNLKGNNSIANEFQNIKDEFPELVDRFSIFEYVTSVPEKTDKAFKTLKIASGRMDKDVRNTLHENLVALSDFDVIKVADPKANARISNFFSRMIIFEYLRTGITKGDDSLAQILPPKTLMTLLKEPMEKIKQEGGVSEQMILDYYTLFNDNWGTQKTQKNKFRNYIVPVKESPVAKPAVTLKKVEPVQKDTISKEKFDEKLYDEFENIDDSEMANELENLYGEVVDGDQINIELDYYKKMLQDLKTAETALAKGDVVTAKRYSSEVANRIDNLLEKTEESTEDNIEYLDETLFNRYFNENVTSRSKEIRLTLSHIVDTLEAYAAAYKTLEPLLAKQEEEGQVDRPVDDSVLGITPITENVSSFVAFSKPSEVKNLLEGRPNTVFIYPTNETNSENDATRPYMKMSNSFGFPIKKSNKEEWSDDTYDENVRMIDEALNTLEGYVGSGKKIAFPTVGITASKKNDKRVNVLQNAPRTNTYLYSELYKRFGYVHPGAEADLGFRETLQAGQPISDKEVLDFMKQCFGKI